MNIHYKYLLKNIVLKIWPYGYGHYRCYHLLRDTSYNHERDKHPVRAKHMASTGWKKTEGSVRYRDYANYEEYILHQRQKFDEIMKIKGGFTAKEILVQRHRFFMSFQYLPKLVRYTGQLLCVGARQGTEVEVLRDMGYRNAYGIDLNPGPHNPYVRTGDFMHLENEPNSLDFLYSNCVDHAFDIKALFAEHARVLKPDGYVMYELPIQKGGTFESAEWDSCETVLALTFKYFGKLVSVKTDPGWMRIVLRGKMKTDC